MMLYCLRGGVSLIYGDGFMDAIAAEAAAEAEEEGEAEAEAEKKRKKKKTTTTWPPTSDEFQQRLHHL